MKTVIIICGLIKKNVHDSSVNIHFKNSYKKIKSAVENEPPVTAENIKSFYYDQSKFDTLNLLLIHAIPV